MPRQTRRGDNKVATDSLPKYLARQNTMKNIKKEFETLFSKNGFDVVGMIADEESMWVKFNGVGRNYELTIRNSKFNGLYFCPSSCDVNFSTDVGVEYLRMLAVIYENKDKIKEWFKSES